MMQAMVWTGEAWRRNGDVVPIFVTDDMHLAREILESKIKNIDPSAHFSWREEYDDTTDEIVRLESGSFGGDYAVISPASFYSENV